MESATEASVSGTARRLSNLTAESEAEVTFGGTALLIVDPQVDFHERGSLAVPGASADAERIARLISESCQNIDELIVTLDSHHVSFFRYRIALIVANPGSGPILSDHGACSCAEQMRLKNNACFPCPYINIFSVW